ncbi:MAG: DNA alkylation repair protein [Burkholderiaceae bacterium]|nr:DNA alkylation repair protein [Burkholderiaceae bacterium]
MAPRASAKRRTAAAERPSATAGDTRAVRRRSSAKTSRAAPGDARLAGPTARPAAASSDERVDTQSDIQIDALIAALRSRFAAHADPARAAPMQAYMKSALPFHGIAAPLRRRLQAEAVRAHPLPDTRALASAMRRLWRTARTREERYAAMELARSGRHAALLGLELLPVYEEMITDGAWWDICDDISGQALGRLLAAHPATVKPRLRRWARGDDLWLRRAAILCQRRLESRFDARLLYDCILPSLGDRRFAGEFFIRKGIGWALRERAYVAPDEVRAFCREYRTQLAPLTLREALRVVGPAP